MLIQSLRMTGRDWRAGELRFLLVALMVAIAALSAVGFFVERLRTGLNRDAHQLLGADVVINADQPINPAWRAEAQRRGLLLAETVSFPSMAQTGEGERSVSLLASVKAVTPLYPLRGSLKTTTRTDDSAGTATRDTPAAGTVWVDPNILSGLKASLGSRIRLGDQQFTIVRLIAAEPDRGASFLNLAPRVMLALSDLKATGLVTDGSRVTYRLMLASSAPDQSRQAAQFEQWLRTKIEVERVKGVRIESLEAGRPEMRTTLDRADRFLSLVGLLSAMLAAVAVAMAARRFVLRHLDACAMLRCLGLTQNQATRLYLIEFALVGLAGSVLGVLVGFGGHYVLLELLGKLVASDLPPPTIVPALQGVLTGLLLLIGFALPPLLQLRNVSHNRVIRREQDPPKPIALATYGLGIGIFVTLLLWQTGDAQLAGLAAAGFLIGLGGFALIAWLALASLRTLRGAVNHQSWRFAVTSLQRRPNATIVQIVSLALGLMALLLLTVVRGDLMAAWRNATPADAPNRFIINIQPDQKAEIEQRLAQARIARVQLYPMIRGRLTAVNGKPITPATYTEDRAKALADREFNLSTMGQMQPGNRISAGQWFADRDGAPAEASVEEGIAKTLKLKLGDTLRFDMGGLPVEASVTSLRKLEWGSMRVNFFVIINPKAMKNAPRTFITAFHLPQPQSDLVNALTSEFPNLTVIPFSRRAARHRGR